MPINESFDPQDNTSKETDVLMNDIATNLSELLLKELRDPDMTSVSHLSSQDDNSLRKNRT